MDSIGAVGDACMGVGLVDEDGRATRSSTPTCESDRQSKSRWIARWRGTTGNRTRTKQPRWKHGALGEGRLGSNSGGSEGIRDASLDGRIPVVT